jgi:hypothetical protein
MFDCKPQSVAPLRRKWERIQTIRTGEGGRYYRTVLVTIITVIQSISRLTTMTNETKYLIRLILCDDSTRSAAANPVSLYWSVETLLIVLYSFEVRTGLVPKPDAMRFEKLGFPTIFFSGLQFIPDLLTRTAGQSRLA